jgi:1,4-dihydroxy-2-naphthoate octaprenyltransferase
MALLWRLSLYLIHLRLPFQLTLAPIFLWGVLLSAGGWDGATSAAFVALHLFLYPAATAFNSAYDRDLGPVGGLERPPDVPSGLLGFSLGWASIGVPIAAAAGWRFLLVYALIAAWTAAYSHPRIRWKASPWKSAAAIALGQGALGFVAGWAAAAAPTAGVATLLAGAAGTALTALGLYPATQVFQVEEDRGRGDRTLAVTLGATASLRFGSLCLLGGGGITAWVVGRHFGQSDAVLVALAFLLLIAMQERLVRRPDYRRAMRILNTAAFCFLLFIALEALGSY